MAGLYEAPAMHQSTMQQPPPAAGVAAHSPHPAPGSPPGAAGQASGAAPPGAPRLRPMSDFGPVKLPVPLPATLNDLGIIRAAQFVEKLSSKDEKQQRAILLVPPFMLQTRTDGTITRMIPLTRIQAMQRDPATGRVLLKAQSPPRLDRDWYFSWLPNQGTYSADEVLDCINAYRAPLLEEGAPLLQYEPRVDPNKVLRLQPGMMSTKEMIQDYAAHPEKVPKPRNAGAQQPLASPRQPAGLTDVFWVRLPTPDASLGFAFETRAGDDPGLYVTWREPGGPADQAGLRASRIHTLDGHPVSNSADLTRVIGELRRMGRLEFPVAMTRLPGEGSDDLPADLQGYPIELSYPGEPLGISFAAHGDVGELYVDGLTPNGVAARSGVPAGMRIYSCDGMIIRSDTDLIDVLTAMRERQQTQFILETCQGSGDDYDDYEEELEERGMSMEEETFDWTVDTEGPVPIPGAAKALVIGIGYQRANWRSVHLPGSCATAEALVPFLESRGFSEIRLLRDDGPDANAEVPTKQHILESCKWLVDGAAPGDCLFLSIVAHGPRLPGGGGDPGTDSLPRDAVAPADFRRSGFITDADFHSVLVDRLPAGARLFILSDLAYGSPVLRLPYRLAALPDGRYDLKETPPPPWTQHIFQVCLTRDRTTSRKASAAGTAARSFIDVLRYKPNPSWADLINMMRDIAVRAHGMATPYPEVGSGAPFDAAGQHFCDAPPLARGTGERREDPPQPPPEVEDPVEPSSHPSEPEPRRRGPGAPAPPWLLGGESAREAGMQDLLYMPLRQRQHPPGLSPPVHPDMRRRLIEFYRYYNPERLPYVTSMLLRHKGHEPELLQQLVEKYGPEPRDLVDDDLPDGWQQVQSPQGDVFYRHSDGRRQWERPVRPPQLLGAPPLDVGRGAAR
eukprot:TRINITY_DN30122_c0_g1_i1.p1 TRINITY_DN30122_c0_g1~~TRINITY_DN30122_c0_g1_i1.p1  ORF type:complete len:905 (+),score=184.08 TRINITY_DN30122_c0_g1_i1:89-2803(+)